MPAVNSYMVQPSWIRQLTLVNAPGTQFRTPVPHIPYPLGDLKDDRIDIVQPDLNQGFNIAYLTFWTPLSHQVLTYTTNPSYILQAYFDLWTLDENGVDIEKAIGNGSLQPWGATVLQGSFHGNGYWKLNSTFPYTPLPPGSWNNTSNTGRAITGPVYICGWRSTITITHGAGTIKLPTKLRGTIRIAS